MTELHAYELKELLFAVHFAVGLPSLTRPHALLRAINYQQGKKLYPSGPSRYVAVTAERIELRFAQNDELWFAVAWQTLQSAAAEVDPWMFDAGLTRESPDSPEVQELATALMETERIVAADEVERYGEAIVREVLNARFEEEEQEEPTVDPSPRRLLLGMINLRAGFGDFLPGGSFAKAYEHMRAIGLPIDYNDQLLIDADLSGAVLKDTSGVVATSIAWTELRSFLTEVSTPEERQAYLRATGPDFDWSGDAQRLAEQWIERVMDLPQEREWIPPFG